MPARNPPKNGRPWTPERVRERIRIGLIADRLDKQALNELDADMTDAQLAAAKFLMERVVAKAEAPRQLNVNLSLSDLIKQSVDARDQ
jgi:hypothetical protein